MTAEYFHTFSFISRVWIRKVNFAKVFGFKKNLIIGKCGQRTSSHILISLLAQLMWLICVNSIRLLFISFWYLIVLSALKALAKVLAVNIILKQDVGSPNDSMKVLNIHLLEYKFAKQKSLNIQYIRHTTTEPLI